MIYFIFHDQYHKYIFEQTEVGFQNQIIKYLFYDTFFHEYERYKPLIPATCWSIFAPIDVKDKVELYILIFCLNAHERGLVSVRSILRGDGSS